MARKQSSVITQARTGKIGLSSYLKTMNAKPCRDYLREQEPQRADYVLLYCSKFHDRREETWEGKGETNLTKTST